MDTTDHEPRDLRERMEEVLVLKDMEEEKEKDQKDKEDEEKDKEDDEKKDKEDEEEKIKEDEKDSDDEDKDSDDEEEEDSEDEEEEDDEGDDEEKEMVCDVHLIRDSFTPGVNGEILLESYVKGFAELNKFIKMLGKLYYFVAMDVAMKLRVVRKKMAGEKGQHYVDLKTMIAYELENNLLKQRSMSGTEAILMLHRGLEFARDLMEELLKEEEEPLLGEVATQIYLATAGRYHAPLLRKPFCGVLRMLPTRAIIRRRIAKGKEEREEAGKRMLPAVIRSVTATFNTCQKIYGDYKLIDMP